MSAPLNSEAGSWWLSAATAPGSLVYLGLALGGVLAGLLLLRAGWRLRRPAVVGPRETLRRAAARLHGESGTATVEFVLVFLPGLLICLLVLQCMLLFSGNLFVHYAAFAATRSAIVNVPATGQVTRNPVAYAMRAGDAAHQRAERAAAFAVAPVSGPAGSSGADAGAFTDGLGSLYAAYDQDAPRWVGTLAGARVTYALRHTDVGVYRTAVDPDGRVALTDLGDDPLALGPKDPLTLGVTHRLHLSIPVVSALFADGTHATLDGDTPYARVTATCTLSLEGVDRLLPPEPALPRDP